jgi:hypothetical protein
MFRRAVLDGNNMMGSREELFTGINTGTVGCYTLTDILKEKPEQLWMCPMGNEDDITL